MFFFTFSDYFVRTHPYFIFILPVILFLEPTFEYFAPGKSLMMVSRKKGTKNHADIYSTIHFVQSNSNFEFLYSTLQSRKPCVHPLHLFLKESWYPPVKIAYLKKWWKYDSLTSKDCFVHVVCCQNGCDSVPCATHISFPAPLQINTFFSHTKTKAYQVTNITTQTIVMPGPIR